MKLKNLLLMGLALCGLLGYIYAYELPQEERQQAEKKPFTPVTNAQIESIIVKKGDTSFTLKNTEPTAQKRSDDSDTKSAVVSSDKWTLEGIEKAQVDSGALNQLLSQLQALDLGSNIPSSEAGENLAPFGLAPEVLRVTINAKEAENSSTSRTLLFGKKSEYLGKRYLQYIRPDGTKDLFTVDDLLFTAVDKDAKNFRKKDPITLNDADAKRLTLKSVEGQSVFEKAESRVPGDTAKRWFLKEPLAASADQGLINDALRGLRNLRAKDFFDGQAATEKEAVFNTSYLFAEMERESGEKEMVRVASVKEGEADVIYFQTSKLPTVFQAEGDTTAPGIKPPGFFREKRFFVIEGSEVQSFELAKRGEPPLRGELKDGVWKIGDKTGDDSFVRQWLSDLREFKADDFPTEAKDFGFADPYLTITVKTSTVVVGSEAKTIERKLVIGGVARDENGTPKAYFAGADNLSEPFIVNAASVEKIQPKVEALYAVPTPTATPAVSPK